MLSPQDLASHLLHPDRLVRDAVVDYFKASWSRDATLAPRVLDAFERFGSAETQHALAALDRFVLTEPPFDAILEALPTAEDEGTAFLLNRALAHAPPELQTRARARILAGPGVFPQTRERVERRCALTAQSAEELWDALVQIAQDGKDRYVGQIDHALADDLVEALGRHDHPEESRLCALLASETGWLEIFAIELAGARRLRSAVPLLVEKFRVDTDYMLERSSDALIRIGDPRAAQLIEAVFATADWNFRNYASGVLAGIKSPVSEAALLELLSAESDESIRVLLCLALCQQFSARGLPLVIREIQSGYDRPTAWLEEEVLPVATVLGVELPEADEWRAAVALEEARRAARALELAEWGRNPYDAEEGDDVDSLEFWDEPDEPFRRAGPKIGRNAPCPCGSGRKFKKCCGSRTG